MVEYILVFIGCAVTWLWGIWHIAVAEKVVQGFGDISGDNRQVIRMEWINEGVALVALGLIAAVAAIVGGPHNSVTQPVLWAAAASVLALGLVTQFTGAKTPQIHMKICPFLMTTVAVLFVLGTVL